ncbi:hypothetical protein CP972_16770 [Streptomyces prasinus]|uniref:Uncharacterized protein n=1 Tax=Streptomyces prasinus TaxID=67345 RepID=A0ABX6AWC4_9ACTN|nr:hypothetical protein CP972_16770 [Streptomyces prasinus]
MWGRRRRGGSFLLRVPAGTTDRGEVLIVGLGGLGGEWPGRTKRQGQGEKPSPCPSQRTAHRGACGKAPVVPQNRRPGPEPAQIRGSRGMRAVVTVRAVSGMVHRGWGFS